MPIFCIIFPTAFAYRLVAFAYALNSSPLVAQGNGTSIECGIMPISFDRVHACRSFVKTCRFLRCRNFSTVLFEAAGELPLLFISPTPEEEESFECKKPSV